MINQFSGMNDTDDNFFTISLKLLRQLMLHVYLLFTKLINKIIDNKSIKA